MLRKKLAFIIVFLFVSAGVVSGFNINPDNEPKPLNIGNWLYVGGNGTGNYTTIQSAINVASSDDNVFVYDDSSPYLENIVIFKSLNLIGENKETTIIDGNNLDTVVSVTESWVSISSFTIINGTGNFVEVGIDFQNNNSNITISNCIITNNYDGIRCASQRVYNISIFDCDIHYNARGIWMDGVKNIDIHHNNISENYEVGIHMDSSEGVMHNNTISSNGGGKFFDSGIFMQFCKDGLLIKNNDIFSNERYGIFLIKSSNNIITENNFVNNNKSAYFVYICLFNKWCGNYWDRPRFLPKPVFGRIGFFYYKIFPWVYFDWYPAKELIEIGG